METLSIRLDHVSHFYDYRISISYLISNRFTLKSALWPRNWCREYLLLLHRRLKVGSGFINFTGEKGGVCYTLQ